MATDSYRHRLEALESRIDPMSKTPTFIVRDFGEPADEAVARYCRERGITRDSLRNVVVIGFDDETD